MNAQNTAVDYGSITKTQQQMWASGDFNIISQITLPISEMLVQAIDPRPGQRVLDVACGTGNASLLAARRFCDVTGIDYVPELIERARMRATAEGLNIDFQEGDAQALPFPDASFDVVLSAIGVMFAPDQEKAARELLRVCKPGGTIGLASWMPEKFGGDFFAAHARHAPPPPHVKPPTRWGTEAGLDELLGAGISAMESQRAIGHAYFHSTGHAVDIHRTYFGPTLRALNIVGEEGADELLSDIEDVFNRYNVATDGSVIVEYEYLQTIATRA